MFDKVNLGKLGKWTGFVGIMTLILGILQAISIIGIIPGIITIILGVKLLGAKSSAKAIAAYGGELPPDQLNKMVNDLRVYFQINGILIIIGLIFSVLLLIAGIVGLFSIPWDQFIEITTY